MNRRFLYLVVSDWTTAPVSSALHRINPARLFHPENHSPDLKKKAAPAVENYRLPRPAMTFRSHHGDNNGIQHLMLLGRGKDKILVLGDEDGQAAIYDDGGGAGAGSFHALPRAPTAARRSTEPLSVALGDGLCVLKKCPGEGDKERSVEALVWGQDPRERGWRYSWRALPPPPPHARKEDPFGIHGLRYEKAGGIRAYAAVGESGLWVSAAEGGTYALDTAAGGGGGEWSKEGDWALPFTWRAEYAPEHGLWFGFSASPSYGEPSQLCAWDLLAAGAGTGDDGRGEPPVARHTWEAPMPSQPVFREQVAHLGCGRFCLARLVKVHVIFRQEL